MITPVGTTGTQITSTAGNNCNPTWPSGMANNDFALMFLNIGGLSTLTTPTGFTLLDNLDESTTMRTAAYYRKCDGTETGALTVAWTGTAQVAASILQVYRGVDTTTPFGAHGVTGGTTTATSRASSPPTGLTRNVLEVCCFMDRQTTAVSSWTPPVGFTERGDVCSATTTFQSCEISDLQFAMAGSASLTARTATSAQSGTAYVAYNLGLQAQVDSLADSGDWTNYPSSAESFSKAPPSFYDLTYNYFKVNPTVGQLWPRGTK